MREVCCGSLETRFSFFILVKGLSIVLLLALLPRLALAVSAPGIDWQSLLDAAGVSSVLAQSDDLIQREVANLEKAPLGFSPEELQVLRQQLLEQLGPERLQAAIIARLQQSLDHAQQLQLQAMLESPRTRFLQTLQAQLTDPAVREALRSYRVQVKENAPRDQRLALVTDLDNSLQHTALETGLKVELRKQLLATVSQWKAGDVVPEALLERQLTEYRQNTEANVSRRAVNTYLYLLKHTPSLQVQALVADYHDPLYLQFMSLCQSAVQDSFRAARQRLLQEPRLVGQ